MDAANLTRLILEASSQNRWNDLSDRETRSIIENLGGIKNVINLCLTNPNRVSTINDLSVSKIYQVLNKTNVDDNMSDIVFDTSSKSALNQSELQLSTTTYTSTKTPESSATLRDSSMDSRKENGDITGRNIFFDSMTKFDQTSMILCVNKDHHLYFRFWHDYVDINQDKIHWWLHSVILTKWYAVTLGIISFTLTTLSMIFLAIFGSSHMAFILTRLIGSSIVVFWFISFDFALNLTLGSMVVNTFDFWFKCYSLILWVISYVWINYATTNRNLVTLIVDVIAISITSMNVFFIDAWPAVTYNIKRFLVTLFSLFIAVAMTVAYFFYGDVKFDPFDKYNFQYTNIRLKDVLLSSFGNILLFTLKPLLMDATKWLYSRCCKRNKHSQTANDDTQRLFTIRKRPKMRWNM